jgi:fluoride ion exporter CrcB/FEX
LKNGTEGSLDLQTAIRAKLVTYTISGFMGPYSNFTISQLHGLKEWQYDQMITFKRSICADAVTCRLVVVFGSLNMQQLHGFDDNSRGHSEHKCED